MKTHKTPETEAELANLMKENCYNTYSYSINGNFIYRGCGIEKVGDLFIWYYTERGKKQELNYFQSEKEIVEFAFKQIQANKWAKSHRIGFHTDKKKINQLAEILQEKGIEYWQDKIPNYKEGKTMYRVFVFGCDIKSVISEQLSVNSSL